MEMMCTIVPEIDVGDLRYLKREIHNLSSLTLSRCTRSLSLSPSRRGCRSPLDSSNSRRKTETSHSPSRPSRANCRWPSLADSPDASSRLAQGQRPLLTALYSCISAGLLQLRSSVSFTTTIDASVSASKWLFRRDMLPPVGSVICRCLSTTFSPLPPIPLPSRREAHIWYIKPEEINDSPALKDYMDLLSPCEKRSVLSLSGEALQKNAILARTLVRTTLSRYLDGRVDPRSIKFKKGSHGKPEIMWQDGDNNKWPLQFSLSHTSSLIACAVALETPIGIDVEENKRKTVNSVISVARRYFTASEVEYLDAITHPDIQQKEFIQLWTLKEAYVKAIGRGFSGAPFKNFTIKIGPKKVAPKIHIEGSSDCDGLTDNCQLALMELNSSHVVAICMVGDLATSDDENNFPVLKVWRTIPYIKDEFISESEALKYICGSS